MNQECCASKTPVMLLTCSGASNVGQLSNHAALELTREGFGKMFCLAGIGGHLDGFVQSAKDVPQMVVIDGCDTGCAKAILDHVEVPLENYIVLTELGIEKNHDFDLKTEELERVKEAVKGACSENPPLIPVVDQGSVDCCT